MEEDEIVQMPLKLTELMVLMRSLKTAQESGQTKTADNEVITKLIGRIARFADRQGAYWDEPTS
jgi:hypothetical protein